MAKLVDARSLSEITQIASNPPRFPRNPSEAPREPLTLYIARVPGTRDIILTTLKPLTKNVTAQDVTACLYYLHVNSKEDIQLSEGKLFVDQVESDLHASLRKSLPGDPFDASDQDLKTDLASASNLKKKHSIKRKPVAGSIISTPNQYSISTDQNKDSLASRLPSSSTKIERKTVFNTESNNSQPNKTKPQPDSHFSANNNPLRNGPISDAKFEKHENSFSVTIIRRDPSSGAQWNIGSISGHPVIESLQSSNHHSRLPKKPYYEMALYLTTPGYTRFRDQNTVITPVHSYVPDHSRKIFRSHEYSFDRKLLMEGSSFWSRASARRKRALSDFSDRHHCLKFPERTYDNPDISKCQEKGYTFISPWGGRCKFLTGYGGRSIRCQHTVPDPVCTRQANLHQPPVTVSELRFNLPVSILAYSTSSQGPCADTKISPEFKINNTRNKMGVHLKRPPLTRRPGSALNSGYRSGDEENLIRTNSRTTLAYGEYQFLENDALRASAEKTFRSSKMEDNSRASLDLGIGQENPGGGNNGKRAKLGKIIIYDEGFKMLDLIISANMAIWWSVWES